MGGEGKGGGGREEREGRIGRGRERRERRIDTGKEIEGKGDWKGKRGI